jgi:prepilin peptidase CpaA
VQDLPAVVTRLRACDLLLLLTILIALYTDCRWQKIFNWLTLPAVLAGWNLHAWFGGWSGLGDSLLGFLCGFLPALAVYAVKGIKGGDVKLIAAIGALGRARFLGSALLGTALAGGLLSLLWTAAHGTLRPTVRQVGAAITVACVPGLAMDRPLHESHSPPLPYGVAIAAGTLSCLFLPQWRPF